MLKYHLSPKTGNPGVCKAKYKCAYGDIETEHYSSKDLARAAYEQKMSAQAITLPAAKRRVVIQTAEKFQEVIENYTPTNCPSIRPFPTGHESRVSAKAILKSLEESNNTGDRYFEPGTIKVDSHPESISVTAIDIESGEEVYFYANTVSGFAFYGDDPQGDAREDLTFRTVFGKINNPESAEAIADEMLDLYESREDNSGKWDSNIDSIKFNYVNVGHFEVNDALRTKKTLSKNYLESIDSISRENILEDSVTVYRGVPRQAAQTYLDSIRRGEGMSDSALLSTSIDPRVAKNFASRDGYVFAITLPKGQKCLDLSKEGNEGEILLPRDTKLENVQIFDTKASE